MAKSLVWRVKELAQTLPDVKGNEWVYDGNCYGEDTNKFIYPALKLTDSKRYELAKICANCPVIETCRYEAVRNQEEGWWGGMTPQERLEWAAKELFNLV